jgi:hypothetical protein
MDIDLILAHSRKIEAGVLNQLQFPQFDSIGATMRHSLIGVGIIGASIIVVSAALAAESDVAAKFQLPWAQSAQTQYQDNLNKIETEALSQMAVAKAKYLAALQKAQIGATQTDNLDEALRIRAEINRLKEQPDGEFIPSVQAEDGFKARQSLESRLAGSQWNEAQPGVIWTLNADGTVKTNDSRLGQWAAISGSEILLKLNTGFVDYWQFDDNLTTISDLHGGLGNPWQSTRVR